MGSDTVTLKVTDDAGTQLYTVHKDLACFHSDVLRAAFTGPFKEGDIQSMDLFDTTKAATGVLIRYMYKDTVHTSFGHNPSALTLIILWILADKLLMPTLKNATINAMEERMVQGGVVQGRMLAHVYANTMSDDSPLRRLLVDQLTDLPTEALGRAIGDEATVQYSHEIPKDIVVALARKKQQHSGGVIFRRNMLAFFVPVPNVANI